MKLQALKYLAFALACAVLALVAALATFYARYLENQPALRPWHTVHLDAEFRATDAGRIRTLADYRALEDRLFAQLQSTVYDRVDPADRRRFNRYATGSLSDPTSRKVDWNRTFELDAAKPRATVLMMHGLTDSPYAMRALAERLHARGCRVVSLRLPGHGTAPSGLLHAGWDDWAAAVRLAARDLAQRLGPGEKLYLAGYSTGAALAVEYALARLQGEALPAVEGLVLLSPAIGVSPAAAFAVWQGRIAALLGQPGLQWTDVSPEYDPYKYSSFPVHAADQIHAGTQRIRKRLEALGASGAVAGLPRILAFQSIADDTVSTPAVIDTLFARLAPEGHQLVLFDINRSAEAAALYLPGAPVVRDHLLKGPALPFDLAVLTNAAPERAELAMITRDAGSDGVTTDVTTMKWPAGVFSLSHVALPFAPADAVYGSGGARQEKLVYLGRLDLQGERGVLAVPPSGLMRLRHNPFFEFLATRAEAFVLAPAEGRPR